ncbi:MAG TPA: SDR family NAD(P)-dependent oxidoreductase [Steroidobacteraceae bacterium]|nr:SDR family NAD(P)-dependent oxidoreductase [Steroidobacteraceae bacterium]HRX89245.1 SDR family NAD(P)-dependent oxidoreductase [Steroidobacteraceae bacterium]
MYPDLEGKVAIVTGAGRRKGLGEAMARRLAAEGCKVVLSDLGAAQGPEMPATAIGTRSELDEIVADIRASGGEAHAVVCNVLQEAEVAALVAATAKHYGQLDIMVNNAGIGYLMKPIIETEQSSWDAVLGVNLRGVFLGIKQAALQMIEQGHGGRIINIGSQASKSGFPFAAAYVSSKHGVVGLTRTAAIELGPHKITVNTICPNHVTTGLGAWQNEFFSAATGRSEAQYLADMRARIPLGRPGLQEDIAKACAFLASAQANYITGEAMNVSGGEEYH